MKDSRIGYYPCGTYYVPNEKSLEHVEIVKVVIELDYEVVKYWAKRPGGAVELMYINSAFDSKVCFNNGNSSNKRFVDRRVVKSLLGENVQSRLEDNEQVVFEGWVFNNPQPKFEEIFPNEVIVEGDKLSVVGEGLPEKIYRDYQDVLNNNDVLIKEEDGSERMLKGFMKRLQLTEDQKSILEKLRKCYQELKDNGVVCVHESEDGGLYALNVRDCKQAETMYEDDAEHKVDCGELQEVYHSLSCYDIRRFEEVKIGLDENFTTSDYNFFVTFEDEQ